MKTYNYKEAEEEFKALRKLLQLYDALHIYGGVPYKRVHHYKTPVVESGYKMGEEIVVKCNGVRIDAADRRQWYAKSCKWLPKHGFVVINFTKKALREYVALCERYHAESNIAGRVAIYEKQRELTRRYIDTKASVFK